MKELERILIVALFFILLGAGVKSYADCTGCGDDGHQVCPVEKKHTHKTYLQYVYLKFQQMAQEY